MYNSFHVGLDCYLRDSFYPYIHNVYEFDSERVRYSIKRMARRTTQLRRGLPEDDTPQNQHGSGASSGIFEQAPQTGVKHFHMCSSSVHLRFWSGKPRHGQYLRITKQLPEDVKETFGWLKAANPPGTTDGLVVAVQDHALWIWYCLSTKSCIDMSVPLAAYAVQAWRQSATLWQAVVLWQRRTTRIDTIKSPPSSTGRFVSIFRFQWRPGDTVGAGTKLRTHPYFGHLFTLLKSQKCLPVVYVRIACIANIIVP